MFELTDQQKRKLKKILELFDFNYCLKVNQHMQAHLQFHSIAEMRLYAEDLIIKCFKEGLSNNSCAGFYAEIDKVTDDIVLSYRVWYAETNEYD